MRTKVKGSVRLVEVRRERPKRSPVKGRKFDALKDVPDIRDRMYEPALLPLKPTMPPPGNLFIMDQGEEGACTGFGLAATINLLIERDRRPRSGKPRRVSPHMLYLMALRHDEWPGEKDEGSSLRGALRGFYNCGACRLDLWKDAKPDHFSIVTAKDARETALGAYYRLSPNLSDYHAAINETAVIYASATVHGGWDHPDRKTGAITPGTGSSLHAFAIVGYDTEGFWVQNSWGKSWGRHGLGHWQYRDWAANIEDAWVLQLAVPAPDAFGLGIRQRVARTGAEISRGKRAKPSRQEIAGHFVHVDNGNFSSAQPYWSNQADVEATAEVLRGTTDYDHLLFYAHGGLNSPEEAAIRTAAMTPVFKANRIYPYCVFYDTGLLKTLCDIILDRGAEVNQRTGGLLDLTDRLVEEALGGVGTRLWNEMKADAWTPFQGLGAGTVALQLFIAQLMKRKTPMKVHLAGHSTGGVLIGHLLAALDGLMPEGAAVDNCLLMAPACRIDFFQDKYRPRLGSSASTPVRIQNMKVYNLTDEAEQDDQVTPVYNKSLLYLVSDAFEPEPSKTPRPPKAPRETGQPLLGMQKFKDWIGTGLLEIAYAGPDSTVSNSTSHGGFDNDPATMNDILRQVLGKAPARPFTADDLDF
ncbi:MAG TPA: C1 family peptidase [Dongiaceae bacterium]